jgi:hypothetical protein
MPYPSIEDYKSAVGIPESFATLHYLTPVMDELGFPIFIAGGPAVVFKMQDSRNIKKLYALKCFTQEQTQRKYHFEEIHKYLKELNSPYLVDYKYLENELWVNDGEYPVLLMEWIEGETMSQKIGELCEANDKQGLARLSYNFNKMAIWLLQQDFAHGDIKPENIQVTPSGDLKLLDYDGMFVPVLIGQSALELGTAEYRHPMRTEADFNANLDDFSILILSLSLLSLQKKPELYDPKHQGDSLLFTTDDFKTNSNFNQYYIFTGQEIKDENIERLFAFLQDAISIPILQLRYLGAILEKINETFSEFFLYSTEVNPVELMQKDENGITYSKDGRRLIYGKNMEEYDVKTGTVVICNEAFYQCLRLKRVRLPKELKYIGNDVFKECIHLEKIDLNFGLKNIGNSAFRSCTKLSEISFPDSIEAIGSSAFVGCRRLVELILPNSIKNIGAQAFSCPFLEKVSLPNEIKHISSYTFDNCKNLKEINFPNTLKTIGNWAFRGCRLKKIHFPEGLQKIGWMAFSDCYHLAEIHLPNTIVDIEKDAFASYQGGNLSRIFIPRGTRRRFQDYEGLKYYADKLIEV